MSYAFGAFSLPSSLVLRSCLLLVAVRYRKVPSLPFPTFVRLSHRRLSFFLFSPPSQRQYFFAGIYSRRPFTFYLATTVLREVEVGLDDDNGALELQLQTRKEEEEEEEARIYSEAHKNTSRLSLSRDGERHACDHTGMRTYHSSLIFVIFPSICEEHPTPRYSCLKSEPACNLAEPCM